MLLIDDVASLLGAKNVNQSQSTEHTAMVKKKWRSLWVSFVLVAGLGFAYLSTLTPIFQSDATIGLNNSRPTAPTSSVSLLEQFGQVKEQITRHSTLSRLRDDIADKYQQRFSVAELESNLAVIPDLASRTITVRMTGADAAMTQALVEELLAVFFDSHNASLRQSNVDDLDALEQQIRDLNQQIQQTSQELSVLAEENRIVSVERDENQIIALLKTTNEKLNTAIANVDAGEELVTKITLARDMGSPIMHPDDQPSIAALTLKVSELESEITALSRQYTQAYLSLDPVIVEKQALLESSKAQLTELQTNSASKYEQDTMLQLALDKKSVTGLQQRIDEINREAREFNFKLQTYNRLSESIVELETRKGFVESQLATSLQNQPLQLVIEEPA